MTPLAIVFLIITATALLFCPRRWAFLPLLTGTCYMTLGQGVELGIFHFPVVRLLILTGIIRVIARRERLIGNIGRVDHLMVVWGMWACVSSIFHKDIVTSLVADLGIVYNAGGIYLLMRLFCVSADDLGRLYRAIAILLLPLSAEMIYERVAARNLFSAFGGVAEAPSVRDGMIRASGPFQHAILAGTVGAVMLPLIIALWHSGKTYRKTAWFGAIACVTMIITSSSSGPVLTLAAGIGALWMWKYRSSMRFFRWAALVGYLVLAVAMKAPPYYLIARIDLTGSSDGWHRARLIESSIEHLGEWWLGGTDYTRHWMPTGVSWSENHTDITNHYVNMGVTGGLPLLFLFVALLATAFREVGRSLKRTADGRGNRGFELWALGAALFAHAITMISVSYFDQSVVFLYVILGAIGSIAATQGRFECHVPSRPMSGQGAASGVETWTAS